MVQLQEGTWPLLLKKYAVSPQRHKKVYWSNRAGGGVLLNCGGGRPILRALGAPKARTRSARVWVLHRVGPAAPPRPSCLSAQLSQASLWAVLHPGLTTAWAHENSRSMSLQRQPRLSAPVSGIGQSGAAQAHLSHRNLVHGLG